MVCFAKWTRLAAAAIASVALTANAAFADDVYVALGDSFAWGYDKGASGGQLPGAGGGYYTPYAQFLDQVNGSVGLTSFNFAVPGETTETYFSGVPAQKLGGVYPTPNPVGLIDAPFRNQSYNTNYPVFNPVTPTSQAAQFTNLADNLAAGDTIRFVTVQLGGNDILGTAAQFALNAEFAALTPLEQQAILNARFNDMATNYAAILSTIRAKAPNADIFLLTYPDAFPGLGPLNPLPQSGVLNTAATGIYQTLADAFGAKLVDSRADFVGKETTLTNITLLDGALPNFHPNAAGYSVIASRLISATAPEPGTLALLAVAGLSFVGRVRRTKRA
ncbi:MAG: GDSL-type esterase/lipase family protein [Capsulimonadales bacterium]|nr:GDSL-type esterase/lipase family protein [Capsulimonadales bacterium]